MLREGVDSLEELLVEYEDETDHEDREDRHDGYPYEPVPAFLLTIGYPALYRWQPEREQEEAAGRVLVEALMEDRVAVACEAGAWPFAPCEGVNGACGAEPGTGEACGLGEAGGAALTAPNPPPASSTAARAAANIGGIRLLIGPAYVGGKVLGNRIGKAPSPATPRGRPIAGTFSMEAVM